MAAFWFFVILMVWLGVYAVFIEDGSDDLY